MLDAYTVKKAIPRVVVAVIAINLSIYICIAAIDITTIIGRSLNSLLVTPFVGPDSFKAISIDTNVANVGMVGALGAGAMFGAYSMFASGIGAGFAGLLVLLLPLIITVALIALAVLFTLIIRQGLLIFLTVISPVAIACYILPGTEKYFRQWWDLFLKTLLVYPIIAAIFAMSNVLAAILLTSANSGGSMFPGNYFAQQNDTMGAMQILVAIIVLYLPLALIPFAFKLAGGAIAAVMNVANSRASSLSGRAGQAIQKANQDSTSWFGKNRIKRQDARLRHGTTGGQMLAGAGALARGRNPRAAVRARGDIQSRMRAREAMQNNAQLQQLAFDDAGIAVMALSGGTAAGAKRAADILAREHGWDPDKKARALASAQSVGFNASNTMGAIELMGQNKSRTLTKNLAGQAGMELVRQSATEVSGGNTQAVENIMGGFAFHSRNAGRLDLGGETEGDSLNAGWGRAGVGQHMQSFGASLDTYAKHFSSDLINGDIDAKRNAAVALAEMHGGLPQATAENQDIINAALKAVGVDHNLTKEVDDGRGGKIRAPVSVEEQLANIASFGKGVNDRSTQAGPLIVSANDIRGKARTYGSAQQEEQSRGQNKPEDKK